MDTEEVIIQDVKMSDFPTPAESSDIEDSDENSQFVQPSGRRWDPLGEAAPGDDDDSGPSAFETDSRSTIDPTRIKNLEEEQEMLSSSLFALTSHFAQVQFRLRQIVDSPQEQRDQLLQSLEEFAFRGIPEITKIDVGEHEPLFKAMEQQRQRQFDLIDQLKRQLTDVEKFAYDAGSNQLPQSVLVEKQKIIIDELKNKLNLTVCGEDLPQLTTEELRTQVDNALVELVGPVKMKDTLVGQLKTQIVDLERFVAYLQCETYDLKQLTKAVGGFKDCETSYATYNSKMAKEKSRTNSASGMGPSHPLLPSPNPYPASTSSSGSTNNGAEMGAESLSQKAAGVLEKASNILNIFAVTQLGCGANGFQKNTLKKTTKGNHWGDLRAQLEIDVQEIISLVASTMIRPTAPSRKWKQKEKGDKKGDVSENTSDDDDDDDDDDSDDDHFNVDQYSEEMLASIHLEITTMVRKHFAITLQRLMEHGLREDIGSSTSLVPFIGCFARRPAAATQKKNNVAPRPDQLDYGSDEEHRQMHVWELILEYYHMKNGDQFNETPARKLSQSFNLDISGASSSTSNKQSLLAAIGNIINIHAPYKRSYNSHFKALISMGINCQKLTQWLNLIFQCRELVQQYYTEWSYVRRTGFRDALKSIDRLSCYHFDLPVDLAIRQFQNIKDVFM